MGRETALKRGATQMKPGIYHGISNADYHGGEGISKTGLDRINRCPAYYMHCKTQPRKETPALVFGRAIHTAILEPHLFAAEYAVAPDVDRRTKAGKEAYAEFMLECGDKTILTADQYARAEAIQAAVYAHPAAAALIEGNGLNEASVFWSDTASGVLCKCRPDRLRDDHIVVDVKTTQNASPEAFMRDAYNYRYHVQAAYYMDGVAAATGHRPPAFVFLAVESEPPHLVACYMAGDDMVALGEQEYRLNLDLYAECMRSGVWGGYGERVQPLGLPAWAIKKLEF
jgi:exodeoxyribonuclease VIII